MNLAKKGFRQKKARGTKDQIAALGKMVENLQQAVRIQQLVFQQFANGFGKMDKDIHNAMGVLNDLQYRTLALVETGTVSKEELDKVAETLKLKDYNEASDREDKDKNFTVEDEVQKDSVVIITSECAEDPTASIFRSKFKLDESQNKEAQEKLVGLRTGSQVELTLANKKHMVTVLGVRKVPPAPAPETKDAVQAVPAAPAAETSNAVH